MSKSNEDKNKKPKKEAKAPEAAAPVAPPVPTPQSTPVAKIKTSSESPQSILLPKNIALNMKRRQYFGTSGVQLSAINQTMPTHNIPESSRVLVKAALDRGDLVSGTVAVPYISKRADVLSDYLKRADEARDIDNWMRPLMRDILTSNDRGNYTQFEIVHQIQQQELKRSEVRPAFLEYISRVLHSIPGATVVQDYVVPQSRPSDSLNLPNRPESPEAVQSAINQI